MVHLSIELTRLLVTRRINPGRLQAVVFVAGLEGRLGTHGDAPAAAAAGALESLARALAVELAPEARVNCVLTGNAGRLEDPLLGAGCPEDAAGAVAFLLSGEARWITGQTLVVDGGRCLV